MLLFVNLPSVHPFASGPRSKPLLCTRNISPSRTVRHVRPVLCTQEPSTSNPDKNPTDVKDKSSLPDDPMQLRTEHLSAYFQSSDTTYQPTLASFGRLALQNFVVELGELLTSLRRSVGLDPPMKYVPPEVLSFELSNEAVANRERERAFANGDIPASKLTRFVYDALCWVLDELFDGRPVQRFWFLETVARMPYFAYSSCLHLYATLGWYRSPTLMNMHHAEELNEAYHLAVMESLGGDRNWVDRFLAFHASILYYWFLVILFLISPGESYRFSELVELHAVHTYSEFLDANATTLRSLPAPEVAQEYFTNFLYYFQEFQLGANPEEKRRRPNIISLYDVFANILLDEQEHSSTMTACTGLIERGEEIWYNGKRVRASARRQKSIAPSRRQQFWKRWMALQNEQEEGQE